MGDSRFLSVLYLVRWVRGADFEYRRLDCEVILARFEMRAASNMLEKRFLRVGMEVSFYTELLHRVKPARL